MPGFLLSQIDGGLMQSWNSYVIGALTVAVVVLGFLYYQERRNNVSLTIDLPNVQIKH
jgi:hypothetical protein